MTTMSPTTSQQASPCRWSVRHIHQETFGRAGKARGFLPQLYRLKWLFLLIYFLFSATAFAQVRLTLRSFEVASDISARQFERLDNAGQPCALVKVYLPVPGCSFSSGARVIGDQAYKDNTYWVYLARGTKRLQIVCPDMEPCDIVWAQVGEEGVQSGVTYILKLDGYESALVHDPAETTDTPIHTTRINGYEYVDLGLSVKWATCNVGATYPYQPGYHFAWGETKLKSFYDYSNSKTNGKLMDDIAGDPDYDAAHVKWGGSWRLPTRDEMWELIDNCDWEWDTKSKGYKVTSKKNGSYIFLPAAGYYLGKKLRQDGSCGTYWSSTPEEGNTYRTHRLFLDKNLHHVDCGPRNFGFTIRAVSE